MSHRKCARVGRAWPVWAGRGRSRVGPALVHAFSSGCGRASGAWAGNFFPTRPPCPAPVSPCEVKCVRRAGEACPSCPGRVDPVQGGSRSRPSRSPSRAPPPQQAPRESPVPSSGRAGAQGQPRSLPCLPQHSHPKARHGLSRLLASSSQRVVKCIRRVYRGGSLGLLTAESLPMSRVASSGF